MFAMNPRWDTSRPSGHLDFQRTQIARVDDSRTYFAKQVVQLPVLPQHMTRRFAQTDKFNVTALDAAAEIGRFGQSQNHMAVFMWRHVVDEIDNAVLKPAGVEAKHDMNDQRTVIGRHFYVGLPNFPAK
jgi:hypothetical protein